MMNCKKLGNKMRRSFYSLVAPRATSSAGGKFKAAEQLERERWRRQKCRYGNKRYSIDES